MSGLAPPAIGSASSGMRKELAFAHDNRGSKRKQTRGPMTKDAKSAPTLEDVARLASVSTATVSRSLNFPDRVSESTRKRVEVSVDALG